MKRIPSTLGFEALVDDEDFERLSAFKWYAHNSANRRGDSTGKRPARRTSKQEGRKVLFLVHHILRAPPGMVVDHINGDPWDNRRANLRVCTNTENLRNRAKHRGCKNPYKGVHPMGRRWTALICLDGAIHRLGSYAIPEEAALAYDAAALALFGDFARLNFPAVNTKPMHPLAIRALLPPVPVHQHRDAAVNRMRMGETASAVANDLGVSISAVCNWARNEGVDLRPRGRPRKEPLPSPSPASLPFVGKGGAVQRNRAAPFEGVGG
jgi:hypothetical protein